MNSNQTLKRLVLCSMLLALGTATSFLTQSVFIGGVEALRIGISGFFTKLPGLIFGPTYGAVVRGLSDFINCMLFPRGAWIPWITLSECCGGFLGGFIFLHLKKVNINKHFKVLFALITALFGIFGTINHVSYNLFPKSYFGNLLHQADEDTIWVLTIGFYICFGVGLLFAIINTVVERLTSNSYSELYIKILITLLIAHCTATTLTTLILCWQFTSYAAAPFYTIYLPRLIEEIVTSFVSAYVITHLYQLYIKLTSRSLQK